MTAVCEDCKEEKPDYEVTVIHEPEVEELSEEGQFKVRERSKVICLVCMRKREALKCTE